MIVGRLSQRGPVGPAIGTDRRANEVITHMRIGALLLLSLLVMSLGATVGLAQDRGRAAAPPTQVDIALDNHLFLRIRTPAAGYTILEREQIVNERLVAILSCHRPEPVTISLIRGKPTIYVDGVQLITVYPQDAAANKWWFRPRSPASAMMNLAQTWAYNLSQGLPQVMPGSHPAGPARPACVCPGGPGVSIEK